MEYVHVEVVQEQISKKAGKPCGDIVVCERTKNATTVLLCDGLGSGTVANIYANLYASRIMTSLKAGMSLRKVFAKLVETMNDAAERDLPYSAFAICRIANSGVTTFLAYEIPQPFVISSGYLIKVPGKTSTIGHSIISEYIIQLRPEDSLIMMSDGIVNSGMGRPFTYGWGSDLVRAYAQSHINSGGAIVDLPKVLVQKALEHDSYRAKDDLTTVLLNIRKGKVVSVLTAPPLERDKDKAFVTRFVNAPGYKIICGGSTSKIYASVMKKDLIMDTESDGFLTPPASTIEGVDLVTEGTVTLNQLYNVLNMNPEELDRKNPVTELLEYMLVADRINFLIGSTVTLNVDPVSFTQLGILPRQKILPLLIEELKRMGKSVEVEYW